MVELEQRLAELTTSFPLDGRNPDRKDDLAQLSIPERGIIFTNDLDGVHFKTVPPLRTTFLRFVKRGDISLPETGRPIGEYTSPEGLKAVLLSRWSVLFDRVRPINKDAIEGLAIFKKAAEDHQRQLRLSVLSGRGVNKHVITKQRLQQPGYMKYFTNLHLNQGNSASAWKESVVRGLTEEGLNVVHIDDDLRVGLCVARVNDEYPGEDRVLVYIMRNIANNPRMLKRSRIKTPDNLVFVRSFKHAGTDFAQRLSERKL